MGRGVANEGLRHYKEAISDYETANEKSLKTYKLDDPVTWNNRANAYAGLEQWEKAVELYRKAADMAPRTYVFPRANQALAMWQVGRKQEGVKIMKDLVRKYPSFADMHCALTAAYWDQGKGDLAEDEWRKTMAIDVRYKKIDWVKNIRRWPPTIVASLSHFLKLSPA